MAKRNARVPRGRLALVVGVLLIAFFSVMAKGVDGNAAPPPMSGLVVPDTRQAPKIDGVLDDPCWKAAFRVETFYVPGQAAPRKAAGCEIYFLKDDQWLYLAFDVAHAAANRNPAKCFLRDDNIQREDNVQLSFDPNGDGKAYYQFLVNKDNVRADWLMRGVPADERKNWNAAWRSATSLDDKGWKAEIAVPLKFLTSKSERAAPKINALIAQFFPVRDQCDVQMTQTQEILSVRPLKNHFDEPENFVAIANFDPAKTKDAFLPLIVTAGIGEYRKMDGRVFLDFIATVKNLGTPAGQITMAIRRPDGAEKKILAKKSVALAASAAEKIVVPVPFGEFDAKTIRLALVDSTTAETLQESAVDDDAKLSPLSVFLDRNYYTTENRAVAVCGVNLSAELKRETRLVAFDSSGTPLAAAPSDQNAITYLNIPIVDPLPKTLAVRVALQTANGETLSTRTVTLIKRPPKPGLEWKIDRINGRLLRDGAPFFPFGIVMTSVVPANEEAFKEVSAIGFNAIVQWHGERTLDASPKAYLEMAEKYGLYVIANPGNHVKYDEKTKLTDTHGWVTRERLAAANEDFKNRWGNDFCAMKGLLLGAPFAPLSPEKKGRLYLDYFNNNRTKIVQAIKDAENFKNLIGYFILDEPLVDEIRQDMVGKAFYETINAADGYHPVFANFSSDIPVTENAVNWSDALGTDPYWIAGWGDKNGRGNVNFVAQTVAITKKRADAVHSVTWTMPQLEWWSASVKRPIAPDEQRCQTYLALIHGSKGVIYYFYPAYTKAGHDVLKDLARQIKILAPFCLAPSPARHIEYAGEELNPEAGKFTAIQADLRKSPSGEYVLLCANATDCPVDAEFRVSALESGKPVKALFSDTAYAPKNGAFSDRLNAFGTRAYALPIVAADTETIDIKIAAKVRRDLSEREDAYEGKVGWNYLSMGRIGRKNLMPNPSLEREWVKGWPDYRKYVNYGKPLAPEHRAGSNDCPWRVEMGDAFHGRKSVRLDNNYESGILHYANIRVSETAPTDYVYSVYLRADREGTMARLRVVNASSGATEKDVSLGKTWRRYWLKHGVPKGQSDNMLVVTLSEKAASATIYVDAEQYEKGTEPTDFEE